MRNLFILSILVTVSAACPGQGADESSMAEMTAEEHARMQSGGQGEVDSTGAAVRRAVHLTEPQETALGIVFMTATRDSLLRTVRTVGAIYAAEPSIVDVTPKIEGFVEELFVDFTGETVRQGQPLFTIYSPSLVAAQEELLTAKRLVDAVDHDASEALANALRMLEASRRRLSYWDISSEQIHQIELSGQASRVLTFVAPVDGIVLEKGIVEGQRVIPGTLMYRIADLSTVWLEGEVFEQDLRFVTVGQQAHIEVEAYPGEHLMGDVSFVYPTVDVQTRTNRIRVTIRNPDLRLKPGMFATVYIEAPLGAEFPVIPLDAVVVTGERNLVFVRDDSGMLNPREIVVGAHAEDRVQIIDGLREGEIIVAAANFLVDAESRLASTGGTMPGMQMGAGEPQDD
ncbi:MAG: efflux RND transporter periplasmic adaptor subunit [Gemmatimonadales bacterium]